MRLAQVGEGGADHVDGPGERDVDGPVEVVRVDLEHVPEDRRGGVRDDDVEAAEHLHGLADGGLRGVPVGEVCGDDVGVEAELAQRVSAPGDERQPRAFGGVGPRGGEADAGAGAGEQHAAAGEARFGHPPGLPERAPARISTGALALGQGTIAIARSGPPEPPSIFIGSATTMKPRRGSLSMFATFSNTGTCAPPSTWWLS